MVLEILFHSNGTFDYRDEAELGTERYGKGHYTLTKDSLFLNFDLTEIKYEGYHISKSYLSSPDSMLMDIFVYNLEKNEVLPNTKIMILEIGFKTFITDTTGKVRFTIPKEEKERTLIITHNDNTNDFHGRYSIVLSQYPRNYEIKVFLNDEVWGSAIKNDIWKYKIKKFKKDYIKLQSKNGSLLKLEKVKIKY